MDRHLETPEELAVFMGHSSPAEALIYFVDWLHRRDKVSDQIATDDFATGLYTLAAELRIEAAGGSSSQSRGLAVAAAVLSDTADGVRVGDKLADEPPSR